MTKKEMNVLKKEVKKATGRNMNTFEIEAYGDDYIIYSFYNSNYDRAIGNKTKEKIVR